MADSLKSPLLGLLGPLGPGEILIVLLIVILLFGSRKLPALAKEVARMPSEFMKAKRGAGGEPPANTGKDKSDS